MEPKRSRTTTEDESGPDFGNYGTDQGRFVLNYNCSQLNSLTLDATPKKPEVKKSKTTNYSILLLLKKEIETHCKPSSRAKAK